jgi:hypothetical protein
VLAQVDTNTKLRIEKSAIASVVSKDAAATTKESSPAPSA